MNAICIAAGCGRPVKARGLCNSHYDNASQNGILDEFPVQYPAEFDGPPLCRHKRPVLTRGWGQECTRCHMPVFATWPEDRQARCRVRWPNFMALIADQVIAGIEGDDMEGAA